MNTKVFRFTISCIFLFVLLSIIFLFLGFGMSGSYTRSSPDCSVWCVIENKLWDIFNEN